jgi:hypothetical protein
MIKCLAFIDIVKLFAFRRCSRSVQVCEDVPERLLIADAGLA